MKYRGADSTINNEFVELGCSMISEPITKSGISRTRMRKLTMNGTSQARRFPHHSGNDAASATKAMAALQINGEILHTDRGPKKSPIGNTKANANNEVPRIARPLYSKRLLSILPPSCYAGVSFIGSDITCAPISSEHSTANCVAAAESGPQGAERTSPPRTGEGSCRRFQRRAARKLVHPFNESVVVHRQHVEQDQCDFASEVHHEKVLGAADEVQAFRQRRS
jgi:hypothetical protein